MFLDLAVVSELIHQLYVPLPHSHKGQNGKVLVVGGSSLFHAASLWALKTASRLVDMVFYSSIPENNDIVKACKMEFHDGIVVPRANLAEYVAEADCILVGVGQMRQEKGKSQAPDIDLPLPKINNLPNEGEQTFYLTRFLLTHFPNKKFVLDAGALQELKLGWLKKLTATPILTPHHEELSRLARNNGFATTGDFLNFWQEAALGILLLKGENDEIFLPDKEKVHVAGGNAGMTRGGTGDVLAGLVAGLYATNEAKLSAILGSFFNKKAGEDLADKVGFNFNASDLSDQLPLTMKRFLL